MIFCLQSTFNYLFILSSFVYSWGLFIYWHCNHLFTVEVYLFIYLHCHHLFTVEVYLFIYWHCNHLFTAMQFVQQSEWLRHTFLLCTLFRHFNFVHYLDILLALRIKMFTKLVYTYFPVLRDIDSTCIYFLRDNDYLLEK
jgi:hypothetical protein